MEADEKPRYGAGGEGVNCCNGCCNLLAFLLILFATFAPFWVWSVDGVTQFGGFTNSAGCFALSAVSATTTHDADNMTSSSLWTFWKKAHLLFPCSNETFYMLEQGIQSGSMYDDWSGRYGFCDEVDGVFHVPASVSTIQAFSAMAAIFSLVASCSSCFHGESIASKFRRVFLSAAAGACATVSYSVALSFRWFQDLRNGTGVLPVVFLNDNVGLSQLIAVPMHPMHWGPCFIGMTIASVFSFLAALILLVSPTPSTRDVEYHQEYVQSQQQVCATNDAKQTNSPEMSMERQSAVEITTV